MDPHNPFQDGNPDSNYETDKRPRQLPPDLPKSLNDRRAIQSYGQETEVWDAWQGRSHVLTNPLPNSPLAFNLSIDDDDHSGGQFHKTAEDNDNRLMEMLAAQAAHRDRVVSDDDDAIAISSKIPETEKRSLLQKALHMAASNGEIDRVNKLISGNSRQFVDLDGADEEGAAPLIYASCFGHHEVVSALLAAGASVDRQDRNRWTALMWAITNRHKDIAKILLDAGASPDVKSSSGRTAFDFADSEGEISSYLQDYGYTIGDAGVSGNDFYSTGFSQDRFELEIEENEMRRRMMMESSMNLEVDLSSLGMDERPETPGEVDDHQDFIWDRCLNDQMFVFQESDLDQILDIIITDMVPQRSPSQKPVPANIIFLSARYAHYHASGNLLAKLLVNAMDKVNDKVERCQWDMTVLAFWCSNATLLLNYLKKDAGLVSATIEFQVQLVELINEIFILIIRDAERRMDRVLDAATLDHETIPGFEDVRFANEWNILKSKPKVHVPEQTPIRSQGPPQKAIPSPRNITSLLSSTLFVLDLYDVHSVITTQILAQLFYWIGAELFNHILSRKTYLARTKAMQIRMNISQLEDWALTNNRAPEHYENGALTSSGETSAEAAQKYFTPVIQLLRWLQCFSSLGDDGEAFDNTVSQMTKLTPAQLLHAIGHYRYEVGERSLPRVARKKLQMMQSEAIKRQQSLRRGRLSRPRDGSPRTVDTPPATPEKVHGGTIGSPGPSAPTDSQDEEEIHADQLYLDSAHMLHFTLPTSVDLRLSYGAGYGGVNKERERKYVPTVPPEFLAKLDLSGSGQDLDRSQWGSSRTEES